MSGFWLGVLATVGVEVLVAIGVQVYRLRDHADIDFGSKERREMLIKDGRL